MIFHLCSCCCDGGGCRVGCRGPGYHAQNYGACARSNHSNLVASFPTQTKSQKS